MTEYLTFARLIEVLSGWHPDNVDMPAHPVIDSRRADASGSVFFAFKGERVDGHDYVEDALARGAVAAVIERDVQIDCDATLLDTTTAVRPVVTADRPLLIKVPDVLGALQQAARWWRQQLDVRVVGVTGSVGKTTTKEVVGRVLSHRYNVTWSRGSYNNEIGLPLTLLGLTSACDRVVLEMGMYLRGDIRFLAGIAQPDVGVITNVEPVHAERAGTIEEIVLGKRELVEVLPSGPDGAAILNYDDPRVRAMAAHTKARVLTYGLSPEADLCAVDVEGLGLEGIRATLRYGGDVVHIKLSLLGRHSIYAALRGAAVGLVEGLSWDEIAEGLAAVDDPLRLVPVHVDHDVLILDDTYNSSPLSALAALDLLSELEGRKIAVLGDMLELGSYERQGHLQVGCRVASVVSELVVVGDLGGLIGEGALRCGFAAEHIHAAPNSEAAVSIIREILRPQDVVLIKGSRGVAMEQIVETLKLGAA